MRWLLASCFLALGCGGSTSRASPDSGSADMKTGTMDGGLDVTTDGTSPADSAVVLDGTSGSSCLPTGAVPNEGPMPNVQACVEPVACGGDAGDVPCTWDQAVGFACSSMEMQHGPWQLTCYVLSCDDGFDALGCSATDQGDTFYYDHASGKLVAEIWTAPENDVGCFGPCGFDVPSCEPIDVQCPSGDP